MSTDLKEAFLLCVGILVCSVGCATVLPEPAPPSKPLPKMRSTIPRAEPADATKEQAPRTIASLRLTEQAQLLIESKRPDEAIRILEQSLNIDPHNGWNYYFLAEAWMLKGNKVQATAFNRTAAIYLEGDAVWVQKVRNQKERIRNISEK